MRELTLTRGLVALVDDEDYAMLALYRWSALRRADGNGYYARRTLHLAGGRETTLLMHRYLLNAPRGMQVDHRDGNGLNNQRHNLRLATRAQNSQHVVSSQNQKRGGFKGVSWNASVGKWQAFISVPDPNGGRGRHRYLGVFVDPVDAAKAYDREATRLYGEFAALNFPAAQTG